MRLRLILSFALIVLVTVVTMVIAARRSAASEVRAFMFRGGMTGVEDLVNALEEYYQAHNTWAGVESLFNPAGPPQRRGAGGQGMMHGAMMNQRLRLADASGRLVYDTSNPSPVGSLSADEIENTILLQASGNTVGYLLPEGGMGFNRGDEQRLVSRLSQAALAAGLAAGGLSLLLALLLAYSLLRPVRELTQAAVRLGQGDLAQRVPVRGNDELSILGRSFNKMADSLQGATRSRRAMTADIAHELRNPLAVQRANLEALQDGVYPLVPENLQPILDQNMLLSRLVDDLQTLALADAGQLRLERVPTNLRLLIERAGERFRPQAGLRKIDLSVQVPARAAAGAEPMLDPLRIEQILSNLLSNALRYTPEGGQIEISLFFGPNLAEITVRDSGPGIPADALPHIFDRFYRADRSRSRIEGGSGLGLAIARQLAEAHGGSLSAANHPQGGAVFTLKLPLNAKAPSRQD